MDTIKYTSISQNSNPSPNYEIDLSMWPTPPTLVDALAYVKKLLYFHNLDLYIRIHLYYFY
jgi:hypothetical protein